MRISITNLETYLACPHKYYLKTHWVPPPETKSRPMQIGSLVAHAIEQALMLKEAPAARLARAEHICAADDDALKVIRKVPLWLWSVDVPVSEDFLSVQYLNRYNIVGRPDVWYVEYAPEPIACHVVELKTGGGSRSEGGHKLEGYESFGIQALRYCVLLHDMYPWLQALPFYRQHIYLGTAGYCLEGARHHVSAATMDVVRAEMIELASQVGATGVHNWDRFQCAYCEYGPACMAGLTGLSEYDILKGEFKETPNA